VRGEGTHYRRKRKGRRERQSHGGDKRTEPIARRFENGEAGSGTGPGPGDREQRFEDEAGACGKGRAGNRRGQAEERTGSGGGETPGRAIAPAIGREPEA